MIGHLALGMALRWLSKRVEGSVASDLTIGVEVNGLSKEMIRSLVMG